MKGPSLFGPDMVGSAILSDCGLYRYELRRTWDDRLPSVAICMLNPSKADATIPDPTITKCIGFARRWGYGGIVVVNLYAWRSTESKGIGKKSEHVGRFNDAHILNAASAASRVVCGWGPKPHISGRARAVLDLLRKNGFEPYRIGPPSKDGYPCHPLMLAYSLQLEPIGANP